MTPKELKTKFPDLADMFSQVKEGKHIHISKKYIGTAWLGTSFPCTISESDYYSFVNRSMRAGATKIKVRIMPSAEKKGPCVEECEIDLVENAAPLSGVDAEPSSAEQAIAEMRKTLEEKLSGLNEPGANQLQALQKQLDEINRQRELDKLKFDYEKTIAALNSELESLEGERDELLETITKGTAQLAGLEEKNKSFTEKWGNILGAAAATGIERFAQKNPWLLTGIGIDEEVVKENLFPASEKKIEETTTTAASEPAAPQPAAPKPAGAKDEFSHLDPDHKKNILLLIAACKTMTLDEFKLFLKVTLSMFDKDGNFSPAAAIDIYEVLEKEMAAREAEEAKKTASETNVTT